MASRLAKRIENLVQNVLMALVRAIDLVDHDDGTHATLQRLGDDELGLRERAFRGVDQHNDAVDHIEDALDLAAEVGVARRIDDVDARVLPDDGGALGKDGDPALALQVIGIHGAFSDALPLAEGARLLEHFVDEGGLAVVDVSDNGDVSELHQGLCCAAKDART